MNLTYSAEQEELRSALRRFLVERSSSADVRAAMETDLGYDPAVWQQCADQLGLQGLAIPEEYGGSGFGWVELAIVFEEMGRALLCAPFFSTVALAAQLLLVSDDEAAKEELLPRIAEGSLVATAAVGEDGRWDLDTVATTAVQDGDGWRVDGVTMFVVDGVQADLLLVVARAEDGLGLFAVDGSADGVARSALEALDLTRRLGRVELSSAPARRIAFTDAAAGLRRALDLALVALAAEQAGAAARCLESATEYARMRVQFGRPIGSFQAIKHKCADMLLRVESAKSAAMHAAWCAASSPEQLPLAASLAKAYCSEAFVHVAAETIQIHGGIGFTWEHDAHLYYRRAKSAQLLFGDPQRHRERVAELAGI